MFTMTKKQMSPRIICFGEILWDNLPSGRTAGGAPMNVAYHLKQLGAESQLISRRGNDQPGRELINFCAHIGLPTGLIQTDPVYPTGEVIGKIGDHYEVTYDIVRNAAWDYISPESISKNLASEADAFVFGSLASRNSVSRDTLMLLLDAAKFKVLDINLRAPHYNKEILALLLEKADLLKLNNDELEFLAECFYHSGAAEKDSISFLQQNFDINEIIVTKGSEGASYYHGEHSYTSAAYPIEVVDTVGAGDSFLAAFLYQKLNGASIAGTLNYALGLGAFIAGKSGACPAYQLSDLHRFIQEHEAKD